MFYGWTWGSYSPSTSQRMDSMHLVIVLVYTLSRTTFLPMTPKTSSCLFGIVRLHYHARARALLRKSLKIHNSFLPWTPFSSKFWRVV
jgi:hypothetical protein